MSNSKIETSQESSKAENPTLESDGSSADVSISPVNEIGLPLTFFEGIVKSETRESVKVLEKRLTNAPFYIVTPWWIDSVTEFAKNISGSVSKNLVTQPSSLTYSSWVSVATITKWWNQCSIMVSDVSPALMSKVHNAGYEMLIFVPTMETIRKWINDPLNHDLASTQDSKASLADCAIRNLHVLSLDSKRMVNSNRITFLHIGKDSASILTLPEAQEEIEASLRALQLFLIPEKK